MSVKTFTRSFDIGSQCDKGRRPNNEDNVLRVEQRSQVTEAQRRSLGRLYIVADGVGGNDNGEVASDRVVNRLMHHYYEGEHPEGTSPAERLQRSIQNTTREIFEESERNNNNMRSTLATALILDPEGARAKRRVVVANIGDSPVILFRKGQPSRKLTQDHVKRDQSLAQAMGDEMVNVSIFNDQLLPDDVLVICSDGLSDGVKGPVPPRDMERVVRSLPAQAASDELVRQAKRVGSQDNISAIVIRNGDSPPPTRMIVQSIIAVLAALLLGGGAYVVFGLTGGGGGIISPSNPIISIFAPQQSNGNSQAATSTIIPATNTPSPTNTLQPSLTRHPETPRPAEATIAIPSSGSVTLDPTATPTAIPEPLTAIPEPSTAIPEPPMNTRVPPMPTKKPHTGDNGGPAEDGGTK